MDVDTSELSKQEVLDSNRNQHEPPPADVFLGMCCAAASGERRHARDLYNPTNALLAKIFRDRPVFPTAQFATSSWTQVCVLQT